MAESEITDDDRDGSGSSEAPSDSGPSNSDSDVTRIEFSDEESELGKTNLLESEVARQRLLSSKLTRRQMLTTFATAGAALAVVPMVALVTTPAKAEALPATPNGTPMTYFLNVTDFINSLIEIPARPIRNPHNTTLDSKYLAGLANIYIPGDDQNSVGHCSASFLCFKNKLPARPPRFFTDISNYISVDNGLIVSWFTPTTLIDLELDSVINSMVTECIVVAATQ